MNSSKITGARADTIIMDDFVMPSEEHSKHWEEEQKKRKYEEDKAYILNEADRFFVPSLRWIESTRNQFIAIGKDIKDYFLVETYEAYRVNDFTPPQVKLVWVKKDSSQRA